MKAITAHTGPIVRTFMSSYKTGVVVSAGKMSKAVKVRIAGQEWNKKIRKMFPSSKTYLVADPNSSLIAGDVVRIASGWRTSKSIRHVVTSIIAPFGPPVEDRPPVLTPEERQAIRVKYRLAKDVRSAARGRGVSARRLKEARKQGLEIPDLEDAMRNTQLMEEEERRRALEGGGKGRAPMEHRMTNREKRKEERVKAGERRKEEARKAAGVQTA